MIDWHMGRSLTAGTALVWWMAIEAREGDMIARWREALDRAEQERADRFYFPEDRVTYIGAHALKRRLLATVGDLPPSAWRFTVGPYGKPEIDPALDRRRLRFNLSHTRGLVACAVAIDDDLGLDVEAGDRVRDGIDIAGRFFAPAEVVLLRATAEAQRADAFVRIWTLKEAYIKATGRGLSCPLDSFAFGLDPIGISFPTDVGDDPSNWQFVQSRPTSRHFMALALRRQSPAQLEVIEHAIQQRDL